MELTLRKIESINILGALGRVMVFVEEPPKCPTGALASPEMQMAHVISQQMQLIIPTAVMQQKQEQPRLVLYLTEEEYDRFNDDVNFAVNGVYNVGLDKGVISIQRA